MRRSASRWLALIGLVICGWLAPGLSQVASAQTVYTTCSPATSKGDEGPVDYGAYCWIDFSPVDMNSYAVTHGGQPVQVNLPGGIATLTFTLSVNTGQDLTPAGVPTWDGAAFGHFAFNGIPDAPVIYQVQNATQTTEVTLDDVTLHDNGTSDLPFVFVAADGESTNDNPETVSFTTSGDPWELVASPGVGEAGYATPTLSYSNGNRTVLETGVGSGNTASYVFTTDNSPGTVTATMYSNGGKQGILFGVKYHTIGLALTKSHVGNFKVGEAGSYTIEVTNTNDYPVTNPPIDPQPVRVIDTLPVGLTYVSATGGSFWTCSYTSATRQVVCDANTLQDLTQDQTFPVITIDVSVDNNAPTSLVNQAEVLDPTTATLVFNVCTVEDNGVCQGSATINTEGDTTVILHSNLSTSTKTVVDKNGGDANPGDVLEYTVTLTESNGVAASDVSVVDDMPAQASDLTVLDAAGGTDGSDPDGGANGTGQLAITGINVPANGSKTIVYEVTIAGDADPGSDIENTVTITNPDPNGTGATKDATITVAQSSLPSSGNKVLYLYDNTGSTYTAILNRVPQSSNTTNPVTINRNDDFTWDLSPSIAAEKSLELPAQDVAVDLVMAASGSSQTSNRSITATLYNGNTSIGSTTFSVANGNHLYQETISIPAQTIAEGSGLNLRIDNDTTTRNRNVTISQKVNGIGSSSISFDTSTVINVDSVGPYDDADCTTPFVSGHEYFAGDTVYLCAVVSDPFGSADINTSPGGTVPSIAISDAGGVPQIASGNMTEVDDSGAATKTFRYAYTIPAPTTSLGNWSAKVTAWEGTEHEVFDDREGSFLVVEPHSIVTASKTVEDKNGGDAEPGDVLEYTITLTETAGLAASNISVTDDMPAHVGGLSILDDAGGTDGSSPTGGANSTGHLAIAGIGVPANGTRTIVYQVTIASGTADGTTIDNSAVIHNPGQTPDQTVSADQVTVNESSELQSGDKYLYLRNDGTYTRNLSRVRPTANGTTVPINRSSQNEWELTPVIPDGETLALPEEITGSIVMAATGNSTGSGRTIRMTLFTAGGTQLGDYDEHSVSDNATAYTYSFDLSDETLADRTLEAGDGLVLRIQNRTTGYNRNIAVYQRNGTTWPDSYSYITFNTPTVINIDTADAYAQPASVGDGTKTAYVQGDHVYLRATVSDPFGTADISSVSISIKDPGGNEIGAGAMTALPDADTDDGSLGYQFDFTVPDNPLLGGWTAVVTAKEGVEELVDDDANIGFVVHGLVTLGKTWSDAVSGDAVDLTIGGATTIVAGTSTAGGTTTAATAAAVGGATVTLGETFTSGSAGYYTISLACTRARDGAAVTVSGTALSRTIVMPSDSAVTCTWTNAKTTALTVVKAATVVSDPVNGTNNPKAIPGAIVRYTITVLNPGGPVDADSLVLTDPLPPQVALKASDIAGTDSGPVAFNAGTSGMTYEFSGLDDDADDVVFSGNHQSDWDYHPVPSADGTDPAVTDLRVSPEGVFTAGGQFNLEFLVKVK